MPLSKRLFIGLELPAGLQSALVGLEPKLPKVRWLPSAQLHLTLSFLGDVEAVAHARLEKALEEVRVPPFHLPVQGAGSFSAKGQPSVIWAGVGKGHPHLFALHQRLQDAVLRAGLEADLRPFHPHITIARAQGISKPALQPFLRRFAELEFGLFRVEEFVLFSSMLGAEGATHTVEQRVALA